MTGVDDGAIEALADDVRARALRRDLVVAVAESLTGGALSGALARAADAGTWFAGGVVAYRDATKFRVLGVPPGPVVSAEAAQAMASGVRDLTGADVAVAVTGVGGPGRQEGHPPGTVFIAVAGPDTVLDFAHGFEGGPREVVAHTIEAALRHLDDLLAASG
jgi:nicotinamide-nucleotide amidase